MRHGGEKSTGLRRQAGHNRGRLSVRLSCNEVRPATLAASSHTGFQRHLTSEENSDTGAPAP